MLVDKDFMEGDMLQAHIKQGTFKSSLLAAEYISLLWRPCIIIL